MKIKVSYLVSYDYDMFLTSVKKIYDHVDKIVVAIDIERKTLAGNSFSIPQSFFEDVRQFDKKNKIEFYFDIFYLPDLTPMGNETRKRNMVLAKLGRGWKIQIDVDEYVYDFGVVANYLRRFSFLTLFPKLTPVTLNATWVTLFKKTDNGFLYIENGECFPFITNVSKVTFARHNKDNKKFNICTKVIHQSWARSEEEIFQKLNNWSHSNDFDALQFFNFWKAINVENYSLIKCFHPIVPKVWNELYFIESKNIDDFIFQYSLKNKQEFMPVPMGKILKYAIKKILGRK